MKQVRVGLSVLCLLLAVGLFAGCALQIRAEELTRGLQAQPVPAPEQAAAGIFVAEQLRFAAELFRQVYSEAAAGENVLLSPLSLQVALMMTANGAAGKTQEEMRAVLCGDLSLPKQNACLHTYLESLTRDGANGRKAPVQMANSIWIKDFPNLDVKQSFLQTNVDYYQAEVYRASEGQLVRDINTWVSKKTKGRIREVLPEDFRVDGRELYLVNALTFEAAWEQAYEKADVRAGTFTAFDGARQAVTMLYSEEAQYLQSDWATGFRKPYADGRYCFAALLPREGSSLDDLVQALTPTLLAELVTPQGGPVNVILPEFTVQYHASLLDTLKRMGISRAFKVGDADFSGMTEPSSPSISLVQQDTQMTVDRSGTRAASATIVGMMDGVSTPRWSVCLDRPFLYLILDTDTNLPLLIGAVQTIAK